MASLDRGCEHSLGQSSLDGAERFRLRTMRRKASFGCIPTRIAVGEIEVIPDRNPVPPPELPGNAPRLRCSPASGSKPCGPVRVTIVTCARRAQHRSAGPTILSVSTNHWSVSIGSMTTFERSPMGCDEGLGLDEGHERVRIRAHLAAFGGVEGGRALGVSSRAGRLRGLPRAPPEDDGEDVAAVAPRTGVRGPGTITASPSFGDVGDHGLATRLKPVESRDRSSGHEVHRGDLRPWPDRNHRRHSRCGLQDRGLLVIGHGRPRAWRGAGIHEVVHRDIRRAVATS